MHLGDTSLALTVAGALVPRDQRPNALPWPFTFQLRGWWVTIEGICLVQFLSSVAPLKHSGLTFPAPKGVADKNLDRKDLGDPPFDVLEEGGVCFAVRLPQVSLLLETNICTSSSSLNCSVQDDHLSSPVHVTHPPLHPSSFA